jgi:hypothetical protein
LLWQQGLLMLPLWGLLHRQVGPMWLQQQQQDC